ncbi:hypothetical protein BMAPRL20_0597 [Burkholderia mallei PRL-20]|nr:conserved hypothetical protein [Burkholderia pseudomallei MSHR346]EEP88547.1 conserved hypothetical protein [Burkholderia mallei GB8 horse 4]EES22875.1 hypothetical protein BURPS1106B_0895 [Burkholderia pseudomallei 1106b]EES44355.1 hypothetical protein BMAPRL20_0597 [Burkholderia mallei PRL-20]KGC39310.1 hypothetical protein DO62_5991 [Burkholderia pseudomallei]KOS76279.1 hypothetical protein DM46_2182 [Burkholderia mallei]
MNVQHSIRRQTNTNSRAMSTLSPNKKIRDFQCYSYFESRNELCRRCR